MQNRSLSVVIPNKRHFPLPLLLTTTTTIRLRLRLRLRPRTRRRRRRLLLLLLPPLVKTKQQEMRQESLWARDWLMAANANIALACTWACILICCSIKKSRSAARRSGLTPESRSDTVSAKAAARGDMCNGRSLKNVLVGSCRWGHSGLLAQKGFGMLKFRFITAEAAATFVWSSISLSSCLVLGGAMQTHDGPAGHPRAVLTSWKVIVARSN